MENQTLEFAINGDIASIEAIVDTLKGAQHPAAELVAAVPGSLWLKSQTLTVTVAPNGEPVIWVNAMASDEVVSAIASAFVATELVVTVKHLDGGVVRFTASRKAVQSAAEEASVSKDAGAFDKILEEPLVPPYKPPPPAPTPNAMKIAVGIGAATALIGLGVYLWRR